MKSISLSLAFLVSIPLAAAAETTKEDVKKLAKAGLSDEVILAFIRANGTISNLSSDDVVDLKAAGVSDRVLNALLARETPRPEPPRQTETQVIERKVYVPSTTHVYYDDYYYPAYYYSSSCTPTYSYYYPRYYHYPRYSYGGSYTRGWRGAYYRVGGGWCW